MVAPTYDTSHPVLVTGATGYLAGWLVKRLLEEGFDVHGAVRNPDNTQKTAHLTKLAADLPGSLTLFKADLLDEGSFDAAMAGCATVFHTASPFTSNITDPQKDLVDPALKGTKNVLGAADRTDSVTRVVLTSSCAAIYGDTADLATIPNATLTEDIWNTTSSLRHQTYSYSKTVAEKAAWQMAKAQDRWRLVTINPSFIIGPGLAPKQTSESFTLIKQLADGTMKSGAPHFEIGAVDVRDVAEAHMRAAFVKTAEGRNIVSAQTTTFLEMTNMLRAKFGNDKRFARRELPKALIWLVGPMINKLLTRKTVARNIGLPWKADNSKSVTSLAMTYRPLDLAVTEMVQQLRDTGQLS